MTDPDRPRALTTTTGAPAAHNRRALTAGLRGPVAATDHHLIEKLGFFVRERIPARVVHAKGSAAFGTLTITGDIRHFTKAAVLQPGTETRILVRFSAFAGDAGAADAERDMHGFALKAYTTEGNWDLVGSNIPVAAVRDPMKFPDLVHALKRHPATHLRSSTAMWDFWSLSPESLHHVLMLFSDRGVPASYRHMNGYGGHAFGLVNAAGKRVWAKFHLKTLQGIRTLSAQQARATAAADPDSHRRDLLEAIARGEPPRWALAIQVMTEAEAAAAPANPFDATRVWPQGAFPPIPVGILTLDRNARHYFTEIEQATFSPAAIVPGICFSPDKLLHGRLLAYAEAQRYRVGTHHGALPVNRPVCPVQTYHADGAMGWAVPANPDAYYEPNSFGGPVPDPTADPALPLDGALCRYDDGRGAEDYRQPAALVRLMSAEQRRALMDNIAAAMTGVPELIQRRQVAHFGLVDRDLGDGLRARLTL